MGFQILYATDLHGCEASYEQLLRNAHDQNVNAVVLGGDLLTLENIERQGLFLRGWLTPLLTRFHAQNPRIKVFGLLGNDDWKANESDFISLEKRELLFGLHGKVHQLGDDIHISGCSFVPVTPFRIGDWDRLDSPGWEPPLKHVGPYFSSSGRLVEGTMNDFQHMETIREALETLAELSDPAKTIYVMHAPPWGTNLDFLFDGQHIGSRAIRQFIEVHQPLLTLHGHIHESPTVSGSISDKIGNCHSINPGDSKDSLQALLIAMEDNRILWQKL